MWRHFVDVRVPIYWEWMTDLGQKSAALAEPRGLQIPQEYYSPLAEWLPCPSHECEADGFDLWAFYYRDTVHTNGLTMENAWLDEAALMDPYSYKITVNTQVGRAKGLKSGDPVRVTSEAGRHVEGRVRLTEAIHLEGLAIGACAGHWTEGMPRAKGKGVFFNNLLELDWHHSSPANLNLDTCAKVRIERIGAGR
ncbi:MAG: hypothetical protein QGF09_13010 [Rhodospirillales bacterium]|nr:hypothetical protein [Rhodospirillales bacterium]